MRLQWLTPRAEVRAVEGAGDAAFAIAPIARGETVAAFGGHPVTRAELDTIPAERRARSIQIDADLYLVGGEVRDPGDMINHSCNPSCGMRGDIVVVARRDISPGEELTYDYAMSDASDYDEFACRCGTPECRGFVRGTDWRDPELRRRYAGWFTTWVQKQIDEQR